MLGGGRWLLEPLAKQGGEFEGSGSGKARGGFNLWGLGGITGTKSASRAPKSESKITLFGSKSVQERSKRSSRGSLRASASKIRFGPHFGPTYGSKK